MTKQIVYVDMDEVLTDFYNHPVLKYPKEHWDHPIMYNKGFFRGLPPLEGAIESVKKLINCSKYDVYIATRPVAKSPCSYSEKVEWIREYIPELLEKIVMTQNKGLLIGDYLIDDTMSYGSVFDGEFIHFKRHIDSKTMWNRIIDDLIGSFK